MLRIGEFALTVSVTVSALVLSACGGSPVSGVPSSNRNDAAALNVGTAKNWQVQAGASTLDQGVQALDFYNHRIVIDAGDSVTWRVASREPHTVAFLAGHAPPPPLSPQATTPAGGTSYDGTVYTNSGLLNDGQTYTLTFPKPGTYPYFCLIHQPVMSGVVVVQNKGAAYPHDQAFYTNSAIPDEWNDLNAGFNSVKEFPYKADGTQIAAGIAPGLATGRPSESTVNRFLNEPAESRDAENIVIKAGTTLTFINQSNNQPHTVTLPVAGQALPPLPPFAPPSGGTTYDGSRLTNSGVMPPGAKYSLRFTRLGSFKYYCLFHDDQGMEGIISVVK